MRIPRELLIIFVILVIAATAIQQVAPDQGESSPALASDSAAPGGSLALYLWLQSLGYRVERLEYSSFKPDGGTKVLLILAPTSYPPREDVVALRRWVEGGGILIVAGDVKPGLTNSPVQGLVPGADALPAVLGEFGLRMQPLDEPQKEVTPSQPLLLRPMVSTVQVEARNYVTGTANTVSYLSDQEHPVAVGLSVGRGKVYVLASTYAISNQGLGKLDNAGLLLNWLPAPGVAGSVAFDEIHHGRFEARSLLHDLTHEPWGWALLYALAMIFLYIVLDGRRFGRAVPSVADTRRVAAEYVVSLANLLRRGDKSTWVAGHYERVLRRQLAAVAGLDHTFEASEIAAEIGKLDQVANGVKGQDAGQVLLDLMAGANNGISEGSLVRLAAETDRIIKACGGRRQ